MLLQEPLKIGWDERVFAWLMKPLTWHMIGVKVNNCEGRMKYREACQQILENRSSISIH